MSAELQWLDLPKLLSFSELGDNGGKIVNLVNSNRLLGQGFDDWRLPDIWELQEIVGTPAAPLNDCCWSSTRGCGTHGHYAWAMEYNNGGGTEIEVDMRLNELRVRLVRTS